MKKHLFLKSLLVLIGVLIVGVNQVCATTFNGGNIFVNASGWDLTSYPNIYLAVGKSDYLEAKATSQVPGSKWYKWYSSSSSDWSGYTYMMVIASSATPSIWQSGDGHDAYYYAAQSGQYSGTNSTTNFYHTHSYTLDVGTGNGNLTTGEDKTPTNTTQTVSIKIDGNNATVSPATININVYEYKSLWTEEVNSTSNSSSFTQTVSASSITTGTTTLTVSSVGTGYHFVGFYTSSDVFIEETEESSGTYTYTYQADAATTIYAKFISVYSGLSVSATPAEAASDGYPTISANYVIQGNTVDVEAGSPETGYTWSNWSSENGTFGTATSASTTFTPNASNAEAVANFTENMTTVNLSTNGHGKIQYYESGEWQDADETITAGVATTRSLKAVPDAGYYFSGWTHVGSDFRLNEGYDEEDIEATLYGEGEGATSGQTLTARFVECDKVYFKNWNDDSDAALWSDVYVYFCVTWEGDGRPHSNTTSSYAVQMQPISETNVYWAYVPHSVNSNEYKANIAFSNHNYGANYTFYQNENVKWGSYNSKLNMCVPKHGDTEEISDTKFYKSYWKNYGLEAGTEAGYYMKRLNSSSNGYEDAATNCNFVVVDDNTIQYTLRVDNLSSDYHNKYMVQSAGGLKYVTHDVASSEGTAITASARSNVNMTQYDDGTPRFLITPTEEGDYVITIDQSSDVMKITVDYPVNVGDYRLLYSYNSGANTRPSDYIKKGTTSKKMSMYVDPSKTDESYNNSLLLQKCTNFSGTPLKPVWSAGVEVSLDAFDEGKGVYVFDLAIANDGKTDEQDVNSATASDVALYSGNFYIKTNAAAGGWTDYKNTGNILTKNTINFSTSDATTFDYYFCKNVASTTTSLKFVVANDYNNAISDTISSDATYLTSTNNEYLPEKSCVRFSYNSYTNEAKRAYLRYSGNNNFLNIVVSSVAGTVYNEEAKTNDLRGATADMTKLGEDDGNFVYQKTVYSKSGGTIDIQATYNSQNQSFITGRTLISSSEESSVYPVRVVYDFKTNNLTTAWDPTSRTGITYKLSNVEYMYIRKADDGSVQQITFGTGGGLESSTVCGVFQFDYEDYYNKVGSWDDQVDGYTNKMCMFYFSLPYAVKVSDIFGIGTYGTDWIIQKYDGAERASKGFFLGDGTTTFWKTLSLSDELEANVGYSLLLDNEFFNSNATGKAWEGKTSGSAYLYFPSKYKIKSLRGDTTITVPEHTCSIKRTFDDGAGNQVSHENTDSHWNMLGVPLLSDTTDANFLTTFKSSVDYENNGIAYLYDWTSSSNTWSILDASSFTFKTMHAYMVQYHGTIQFKGTKVVPASIAARRVVQEETENYTVDLEVLDGEKTQINHTYVELREDASDDFELNEDVYLARNAKDVEVFTFAGNYDVAANVLSKENHAVQVGLFVNKAGTYTFSMPSNFSGGVTLVDNVTKARTNLALDDYEVNLEEGTDVERFVLEVSPSKMPTSIDGVEGEGSLKDGKAHKIVQDGVMYIVRDGKLYNATGALVK